MANHGLKVKSGPQSGFVNKALLEQSHVIHLQWSLLLSCCNNRAESCDRDHIYCLYRERLQIPSVGCYPILLFLHKIYQELIFSCLSIICFHVFYFPHPLLNSIRTGFFSYSLYPQCIRKGSCSDGTPPTPASQAPLQSASMSIRTISTCPHTNPTS